MCLSKMEWKLPSLMRYPCKDGQGYRGIQPPDVTVCLCCLVDELNKHQTSGLHKEYIQYYRNYLKELWFEENGCLHSKSSNLTFRRTCSLCEASGQMLNSSGSYQYSFFSPIVVATIINLFWRNTDSSNI